MKIVIDPRQKKPLAQQICEKIEQKIANGELKDGDALPPVRVLADQLGVNFNTVARAYRSLDLFGRITTQQGRGSYVTGAFLPHPLNENPSPKETIEQLITIWKKQALQNGLTLNEVFHWFEKQNASQHYRKAKIVKRQSKRAKHNRVLQQAKEHKINQKGTTGKPQRKKTHRSKAFHVKQRMAD